VVKVTDGQAGKSWMGKSCFAVEELTPRQQQTTSTHKGSAIRAEKGGGGVKTIGNGEGHKVEGRGRRTSADCPLCGQLPALIPSIVCPNFVIS